jgi:hypothetical protein
LSPVCSQGPGQQLPCPPRSTNVPSRSHAAAQHSSYTATEAQPQCPPHPAGPKHPSWDSDRREVPQLSHTPPTHSWTVSSSRTLKEQAAKPGFVLALRVESPQDSVSPSAKWALQTLSVLPPPPSQCADPQRLRGHLLPSCFMASPCTPSSGTPPVPTDAAPPQEVLIDPWAAMFLSLALNLPPSKHFIFINFHALLSEPPPGTWTRHASHHPQRPPIRLTITRPSSYGDTVVTAGVQNGWMHRRKEGTGREREDG